MEDGVWKFLQTYASIGIANDDIGLEYHDLTRPQGRLLQCRSPCPR